MYKSKLIGIGIVAALLLTSFVVAETYTSNKMINSEVSSIDVDVPIWRINDSWTYNMEYYSGDEDGSMASTFSCEMTFTVIGDTGDSYKLEGEAASVSGMGNLEGVEVRFTPFTSIGIEVELRKSDLGLVQWTQHLKGLVLFILGGIPLPMQGEVQYTSVANPTWVFLPFPLFDDKAGVFAGTEHLEETNIWLIWRLIHIVDAQSHWLSGNPGYTVNQEVIGCEAGSYDVYYVNAELILPAGLNYYRTYYAEDVGNVVIGSVNLDYVSTGETYQGYEFELLSTTYEP